MMVADLGSDDDPLADLGSDYVIFDHYFGENIGNEDVDKENSDDGDLDDES
jgi:hypothetical protein